MSILADAYSSYLTDAFDYKQKMNFFSAIFSEGYHNVVKDPNFVTEELIKKIFQTIFWE